MGLCPDTGDPSTQISELPWSSLAGTNPACPRCPFSELLALKSAKDSGNCPLVGEETEAQDRRAWCGHAQSEASNPLANVCLTLSSGKAFVTVLARYCGSWCPPCPGL